MEYFNIFVSFLVFDVFLYAQSRHFKGFHGSSIKFKVALGTNAAIWSFIGLSLLAYYGYMTVWYYAVILFLANKFLAQIVLIFIDSDRTLISIIGFFALPFFAYFIYWNIIKL